MAPKKNAGRRHLAVVIADREVAEGQDRRVYPRMEALGETRLAPVRSAECMAEAGNPSDMMAAGAGTQRNGLRPMPLANVEYALGDLIESIVPGNSLPLAGLAFSLASQRIFQSIGVVDKVGGHRPDRTQAAMIERRFAIALDLQQHAISDMQQHAAPAVATAADAFEDGGGWLPVVLQERRWLLDVHADDPNTKPKTGEHLHDE